MGNKNAKYSLRTATANDAKFLFDVKIEAMKPVSAILRTEPFDYDKEFKESSNKFEPEKVQVIQYEGRDVGRLRVVRSPDSIYIGGIQILPEFQGKGIGTAVLVDLIIESESSRIPVTLEVHHVNDKAISFYRKLGFEEAEKTEKKILMKYKPKNKQTLISVFDEKGIEIGKKPKSEIDKKKDIFQSIYVRVFIGGKIFLTKVLRKKGGIAKTNEGKWGLPVATILRCEESPEDAFKRACLDDIGVIPKIIKSYEKKFTSFESTSPRIVFAYDAELDVIPNIEDREYLLVDAVDITSLYKEGNLAETATIFNSV